MPEKHPVEGVMGITMEKIKEMVDVNTIIGTPITVPDGTTIIPVSKVSFGFASGGSDLPTKDPKNTFGAAGGAGITLQPIAFLVVHQGNVRLLQISAATSTADKIVDVVPEVIDKISSALTKKKDEKEPEAPADSE